MVKKANPHLTKQFSGLSMHEIAPDRIHKAMQPPAEQELDLRHGCSNLRNMVMV